MIMLENAAGSAPSEMLPPYIESASSDFEPSLLGLVSVPSLVCLALSRRIEFAYGCARDFPAFDSARGLLFEEVGAWTLDPTATEILATSLAIRLMLV